MPFTGGGVHRFTTSRERMINSCMMEVLKDIAPQKEVPQESDKHSDREVPTDMKVCVVAPYVPDSPDAISSHIDANAKL